MLMIGIAGGSGSGKTTVVKKIAKQFNVKLVSVISQDAYYKDLSDLGDEDKRAINFDHPNSIEFTLLQKHLKKLRDGKSIEMPTYSYVTCTRGRETVTIEPQPVIIVEGILIFTDKKVRDFMDLRIFVDTDADDRLTRIIRRDIKERNRTVEQVLNHYHNFVKPMHIQFIEPTKRFADIIVPEGGNNDKAIAILSSHIGKHV
ncbi:MAG: uridine kinase [Bacteroidales bacterium]|jgi:uridine kinase|nr:uridine kinase [Bacteroidales bacterium]